MTGRLRSIQFVSWLFLVVGAALWILLIPPFCVIPLIWDEWTPDPLLWLIAALASLAAGASLRAWFVVRRDEHELRHCRQCGYDLSGTPHARVCPECGRERGGRSGIRDQR
jgi:hypothetical protein